VKDAVNDVRRRRSLMDPVPLRVVVAAVLGGPLATATVGLLLGLAPAPLGLLVAAVACPWLALCLGCWLGLRLLRERELQRRGQRRPELVGLPAAGLPPDEVDPGALARLPPELRWQVERIQRKAEFLREREPQLRPGAHDLTLVRRMLGEYLPTTLDAYLALPSGADGWSATPERTVRQVLADQLDILETKLDEVGDDIRRVGADRRFPEVPLTVHRAES
jgi:hypothetical protein